MWGRTHRRRCASPCGEVSWTQLRQLLPRSTCGRLRRRTGFGWLVPSSSGRWLRETSVADVVLGCPWEADSMTISDLLMSQHRWGRTRCRRFLSSIPMSETKTIGTMTDRQRRELARMLSGDRVYAVAELSWAVATFGRRRSGRGRYAAAAGAEAGPPRGDLDDVAVGIAQVDRGGMSHGRRHRCTRRRGRAGSRATPPAPRRCRRSARSGASSRRRPCPWAARGTA